MERAPMNQEPDTKWNDPDDQIAFSLLANKNPQQLDIIMPAHATVEELKQKVLHFYDVPLACLRLIFQGRLMSNKESLSTFAPKREPSDATIIDVIPDDNPRGFDRLREMGFDAQDIREFRAQFYNTRLRADPNLQREELYQLEEEFLRSLSQADLQSVQEQSQRQERENGDNWDLVFGMAMGFFLGLIMLFWIWDNTTPTTRTKCGILAGLGCNVSFCLLKAFF